jgi:archaellum component FlaC
VLTWQLGISALAAVVALLGLLRLAVFDILNKIDKQFEANERRHQEASRIWHERLKDRDERIADQIDKVSLKLSNQFITRSEYEKEVSRLHNAVENLMRVIEQVDQKLPPSTDNPQ